MRDGKSVVENSQAFSSWLSGLTSSYNQPVGPQCVFWKLRGKWGRAGRDILSRILSLSQGTSWRNPAAEHFLALLIKEKDFICLLINGCCLVVKSAWGLGCESMFESFLLINITWKWSSASISQLLKNGSLNVLSMRPATWQLARGTKILVRNLSHRSVSECGLISCDC